MLHSSVHLSPGLAVPKLTLQPLSKARREIKHPANLKPTEKGLAGPPQASESRVPTASPRCPWKQRPVGKAAPGPGGLQFRLPTHPSPTPPMGPARPAAPAPPLASRQGPDSQPQGISDQGEQARQSRGGPEVPSSALLPQAAKAGPGACAAAAPTRPASRALAWADVALVSPAFPPRQSEAAG